MLLYTIWEEIPNARKRNCDRKPWADQALDDVARSAGLGDENHKIKLLGRPGWGSEFAPCHSENVSIAKNPKEEKPDTSNGRTTRSGLNE